MARSGRTQSSSHSLDHDRLCGSGRVRTIVLLIARPTGLFEQSPRCGMCWGRIEHRLKEFADCGVLSGPIHRGVAVPREQCFTDVVSRVVGDSALDCLTGQKFQLAQAFIGLLDEIGGAESVSRNLSDPPSRNKCLNGHLLGSGQGHSHGAVPIIATFGLPRTLSRKPEGWPNSVSVRTVGLIGRPTYCSMRRQAS